MQVQCIKQKLNKKLRLPSESMERSPIKVPSENDETAVKDEAQEVDEDTLQGEVKLQSQLPIISACDHTNGYFCTETPIRDHMLGE